ncbi:MFS transporter [Streptomyces sp. WMMB303]|uniref:MFS transporter n=1 Tax=Streptomyces sp. WMMB303 TaxID=3034154 RepID=UPI0023ECD5F7|nr:MFS transporter [Streptomyces sp. WMMB303]MDF4251733.1 MFS transporter [Streptomyces sp. WMMB303]
MTHGGTDDDADGGTDVPGAGTSDQPSGAAAAGAVSDARFRLVIAGFAVSQYGSFLNMVALNLFVYTTTGSALSTGLFMAVRLISGFLAGPACGPAAARFGARSVMLWANLLQAAALLALVLAPDGIRAVALFVSAAVVGAGGTHFLVALRGAVPELVGRRRRAWANSWMATARSGAMVVGFASAGVVVPLLGYTAAFLIDMATFLCCAATIALLPSAPAALPEADGGKADPDGGKGADDGEGTDGGGQDTVSEGQHRLRGRTRGRMRSAASVAALTGTPVLLLMVGLRSVDALGSSSHNVALPVYSTAADPADPAAFVSRFWLCWGVGNVLMQQLIRWYGRRTGKQAGARGFGVGTVVMSVSFILAFAGFPLAAVVPIALVAGAADGLTEVSYVSHLQTLPADVRTPVFGLSAAAENFGFGVGMVGVSALLEAFAPLTVVAWSHGAAVAVAGVFLTLLALGPRLGRSSPSQASGSPRGSRSTDSSTTRRDQAEKGTRSGSHTPDSMDGTNGTAGTGGANRGEDPGGPDADSGDRGGVPAPRS